MEETTIQDMTREAITCMDEQALRKTCMDLAKSADRLSAIIQDYGIKREGQLFMDLLDAEKKL